MYLHSLNFCVDFHEYIFLIVCVFSKVTGRKCARKLVNSISLCCCCLNYDKKVLHVMATKCVALLKIKVSLSGSLL